MVNWLLWESAKGAGDEEVVLDMEEKEEEEEDRGVLVEGRFFSTKLRMVVTVRSSGHNVHSRSK